MLTENYLTMDCNLTMTGLIAKMKDNIPIVVKALRLDNEAKLVECKISDQLKGYIPVDEFEPRIKVMRSSISNYDFYPQIARKMGKEIMVKVTHIPQIGSSDSIYLSRKQSIIESYEMLKQKDIIECEITSVTDMALYLDCGNGVPGRVYVNEAVSTFVETLKTSGFRKGQLVDAKIINYNDDYYNLDLSLLKCCPIKYNLGDIVIAKVRNKLDNNEFSLECDEDFFVEIFPSHFSGILRAKKSDNLRYDDTVTCIITTVKPDNKYKLRLTGKEENFN